MQRSNIPDQAGKPEDDHLFRRMADNAPMMIWVSGVDKKCTWFNKRWLEFTGRTMEQELGDGWAEGVHPEDFERCIRIYVNAFDAREPFEMEYRLRRSDGQYRWIEDRGAPTEDEHGAFGGYTGSCVDITDRKTAEMRFTRFMQHLPGLAWIKDGEGRYVFVNDATERVMGMKRGSFIGRKDHEVFAAPLADHFMESDRAAIARGGGLEMLDAMEEQDGLHHSLVVKFPIPASSGSDDATLLGGIAIDITDRIKAEAAQRESDERFELLADNMAQLAWIGNAQGATIWFNKRWFEYTGLDADAIRAETGRNVVHPDHQEKLAATMRRSFADGTSWEQTFMLRRRDGEYRWFLSRCAPVYNDEGQVVRWFGTNTDITDSKNAEAALQAADLRKDEFLATLAHELRNPLAPLRNGLALIDPVDPMDREVVEMMDRQLNHLVRLVDDLMDVSRITRGKIDLRRERLDLRTVLEQTIQTSRSEMESRGQRFHAQLASDPTWVEGDATRLMQVVSNLLNNAAKYTPNDGHIHLHMHVEGSEVVVRVKDDGIGIPPDMLPDVFNLFAQVDRTLQRSQGGLGIGLNIVKRLVELHGGSVEGFSEGRGKGSEFVVRLPLVVEVPGAGQVTTPTGRTVVPVRSLVVDDNEDVARSLVMVLQRMGCDVRSALNASDTLQAGRSFRPELVLMDIGMPIVDGYELCRQARQEEWGNAAMIVAVTGWGQDEDKRRAKEAGFDRHIVKPISKAELEELLRVVPERRFTT